MASSSTRTTLKIRPVAATYDFGDFPIAFQSRDRGWLRLLEQRYGKFRRDGLVPKLSIEHEVNESSLPDGLPSPLAVHQERAKFQPFDDGFLLLTDTSTSEVLLPARRARLRSPSAMYPLDNLLRHLLPVVLERSVIFHGAGVVIRDKGYVASGSSGAGKSTLAGFFGSRTLSDELTAVRLEPEPARVCALPFWNARPGAADLGGLFLLRHGEEHRLTRLAPNLAMRQLMRQIVWPLELSGRLSQAFHDVARLAEQFPVYELAFARREDVRDFLEEQLK